ncbi:MAG: STAS domain-containing protein [Chromatiales bacterium]|jgi:phospholipid transport system transporter-binding protein
MADARIVRNGAFRFHVEGEMTFATVGQLLRQTQAYFDKPQNLEVDLSRVTGADSAGLSLLLEWKARAALAGAEVVVEGLPEAMQSIAHLCRIEKLLTDMEEEISS